MRSLTLADELMSHGVECHFLCNNLEKNLCEILTTKGHIIHNIDNDEHALEALEGLEPAWLIVDHYELDNTFEDQAKSYVQNILVIDDMANRHHACDILLDQNPLIEPEDYLPWVGSACHLLLGADYALLRTEFQHLRHSGTQEWRKGLICFGGTDPQNILLRVLEALDAIASNTDIEWTCIAGVTNPHWQQLQEFSGKSQLQINLLKHSDEIGKLLASHDFAIGASGGMLWERMCIGIPTLAIAIAENQRPGINLLKHFNLAATLEVDAISASSLEQSIIQVRQNASVYRQRNQEMLDGMGASRTVQIMLERT